MKKTLFLKAPLIILNVISFAASFYAAYEKIGEVSWGTPIILGILLMLYGLGTYFERKKDTEIKEYDGDM